LKKLKNYKVTKDDVGHLNSIAKITKLR